MAVDLKNVPAPDRLIALWIPLNEDLIPEVARLSGLLRIT
jgi:hypothetical protein